jgi:hypothetical protein
VPFIEFQGKVIRTRYFCEYINWSVDKTKIATVINCKVVFGFFVKERYMLRDKYSTPLTLSPSFV